MAELIDTAEIPSFVTSKIAKGPETPHDIVIYCVPEKPISTGERFTPWQHLHHPGYWLRLSTTHLYRRRELAREIPDEDQNILSQGQNAAAYDTYLVPDPAEEAKLDHSILIIESLTHAINYYSERHQGRVVQELKFKVAKEHMRAGSWHEASKDLHELWRTSMWRREGWYDLAEELAWAFRECSVRVGDAVSVIAIDWELMSRGKLAGLF